MEIWNRCHPMHNAISVYSLTQWRFSIPHFIQTLQAGGIQYVYAELRSKPTLFIVIYLKKTSKYNYFYRNRLSLFPIVVPFFLAPKRYYMNTMFKLIHKIAAQNKAPSRTSSYFAVNSYYFVGLESCGIYHLIRRRQKQTKFNGLKHNQSNLYTWEQFMNRIVLLRFNYFVRHLHQYNHIKVKLREKMKISNKYLESGVTQTVVTKIFSKSRKKYSEHRLLMLFND